MLCCDRQTNTQTDTFFPRAPEMFTSCVHLTRPFHSPPDSHMELLIVVFEKRWKDLDRLKTDHSGNNKRHAHFLIVSPQTHGFQTMTQFKKNNDIILFCEKMSLKILWSDKATEHCASYVIFYSYLFSKMGHLYRLVLSWYSDTAFSDLDTISGKVLNFSTSNLRTFTDGGGGCWWRSH